MKPIQFYIAGGPGEKPAGPLPVMPDQPRMTLGQALSKELEGLTVICLIEDDSAAWNFIVHQYNSDSLGGADGHQNGMFALVEECWEAFIYTASIPPLPQMNFEFPQERI